MEKKFDLNLIGWLLWRLYLRRDGFVPYPLHKFMAMTSFCTYVLPYLILVLFPCTAFYFLYLFALSLYWISFLLLFDFILTIFTTCSLVEGRFIYRVSTCFHPIISLWNFANRDDCRNFVKKYTSMCSVLQYAIDVLLLSDRTLVMK